MNQPMTPELAQEIMERGGFPCELIQGCVPSLALPKDESERTRMISLAGQHELACHIYEDARIVILVPVKATIEKTRQIVAEQLL